MFVVKYRKIFYTFSAILVIASLLSISVWGLDLGIDFKGGTLVEIDYPAASFPAGRPDQSVIQGELSSVSAAVPNLDSSIQPSGTTSYILRLRSLSQPEKVALESALGVATSTTATTSASTGVQETSFESIGPVLGAQAARSALLSIVFVVIAIVLFIAYAFRRVSQPVSSWKYGVVAIIDLLHNIIIPTGVFSVLGHFYGYEVDTLFVTALLVVLGFSVHDTIVVFDRVRENLRLSGTKKSFEEIVGMSIAQTFTRSVNTSLTTLIALFALYFVGGSGTQNFSLVLIIGIAAGTYASIFLGSPLLVTIQKTKMEKSGKWVFYWFLFYLYFFFGFGHSANLSLISFVGALLMFGVGRILYLVSTRRSWLNTNWKKILVGFLSALIIYIVTPILSILIALVLISI